MTGGHVVVLGATGRNFAAGMSGGVACALDLDGMFARRCNTGMVDLEPFGQDEETENIVHELIARHVLLTGSTIGERVLAAWPAMKRQFVTVMPRDFKRARSGAIWPQAESPGAAVTVAVRRA
jgi:glutamate synthase domain-containing protein 3